MRVYIQSHLDACVTKHLLHYLGMDSLSQEDARYGMAEIMQPDLRKVRRFEQRLERSVQARWL
jgi:hypothetical protein